MGYERSILIGLGWCDEGELPLTRISLPSMCPSRIYCTSYDIKIKTRTQFGEMSSSLVAIHTNLPLQWIDFGKFAQVLLPYIVLVCMHASSFCPSSGRPEGVENQSPRKPEIFRCSRGAKLNTCCLMSCSPWNLVFFNIYFCKYITSLSSSWYSCSSCFQFSLCSRYQWYADYRSILRRPQ